MTPLRHAPCFRCSQDLQETSMEKRHWALYGMIAVMVAGLVGAMGAAGAREALSRAPRVNDAAYRGGLDQGRLAAERGGPVASVGRGRAGEKREHFGIGYGEGLRSN